MSERMVDVAGDVAVVGAGAAGLTAALRAAESGARTLLLNAHPRVGLKILMSGGTRCNVTHREVSERDFHGGSRRFVAHVLRAFPAVASVRWMESLGVSLKLEPTGKLFPVTDDAHTVLEALLRAVRDAGVQVESGARVVRLERTPAESPGFRLGVQRVRDSNAFLDVTAARGRREWPLPSAESVDWVMARRVILACGGLSFPRTGSDGTGYALASSLGHTIVPPIPALTPLTADDALCTRARGVTFPAALALRDGDASSVEVTGSLLVTHFGFSGPAALDLSRHWLGAMNPRVTMNVLPDQTPESSLASWRVSSSTMTVRRWIGGRIPERLLDLFCEESGVLPGTLLSQVPRPRREALFGVLHARPLEITGTLGYEKAEVTAGGVSVDEVDSRSLESKLVPGLFLCGEILDVEGRLGGFNFQWAWSSGTVAGRSAGSGS